ncbi:MAG: hypothetical protein KDC53_10015 [Saprospiraceae bacterium]|nr:hypothetical protein [Saprospiraceae bacterium]
MEQSGVVNIMGTLAFRDSSLTVTIDDQLVNVGYFSYLRISADVFVPSDRTVLLSDGIKMGQILYLECTGGAWQLFDNQTLNHVNTSGTRNFAEGDTIQLIWNGTTWLENHFSDN